eukprot:TRINITY_DN7195_c0_g1_i2.p1 TRINITY_DN7195_c0_g1~~TRINITY_DN7195_c0_g1_i2.p1  ORF type:complete len:727 (-),score=207.96 TRINITY_DN7195_c0_g1_i2:74-2080(-)
MDLMQRLVTMCYFPVPDPKRPKDFDVQKHPRIHAWGPRMVGTVARLCAASITTLLKDIIPGYRIVHTDTEGVKHKKDVIRLRTFETRLLKYYKLFVAWLVQTSSACRQLNHMRYGSEVEAEVRTKMLITCVQCMCEILAAKPHFNYRDELINSLVPYSVSPIEELQRVCYDAFCEVFKDDKGGDTSLVIVSAIARLLKKYEYKKAKPMVLRSFLHLNFSKVTLESINRMHLTSKQRKRLSRKKVVKFREEAKLQRDLQASEAQVNADVVADNQTKTLNEVFTVYFRVLKSERVTQLLPNVLEGLGSLSHLINVEYQGDMLKCLREVADDHDDLSLILMCCNAAFNAMRNQGDTIELDFKVFYARLYEMLYQYPARAQVVSNALFEAYDLMINKNRAASTERAASLIKRLMSVVVSSASVPAVMAVLNSTGRGVAQHPRLLSLFDAPSEQAGESVFMETVDDPDHSFAHVSATLWEHVLLSNHYHPSVRAMSQNLLQGSHGPLSRTPQEVMRSFSAIHRGVFKPPIQPPPPHPLAKRLAKFERSAENKSKKVDGLDLFIQENSSVHGDVQAVCEGVQERYADTRVLRKVQKEMKAAFDAEQTYRKQMRVERLEQEVLRVREILEVGRRRVQKMDSQHGDGEEGGSKAAHTTPAPAPGKKKRKVSRSRVK